MELTKEEKKCARCQQIKHISEFNKDKQKKDGLRNYCKMCDGVMYEEKKKKKELQEIQDSLIHIVSDQREQCSKDNEGYEEEKEKESKALEKRIEENDSKTLEKYDTSVENLARLVSKQYGEDIQKADEVYDLFYNLISAGDKSQASKEALTKSLELRMSASNSIIQIIKAAADLQKAKEKNKGKFSSFNINNVKDNFELD